MKALIGFLSLALGAAAIALIVKIQTDPFAFTSHVPVVAEPVATQGIPVEAANVITLADVKISGILSRQPTHKPRAAVPRRATAPKVKVVPAPCVDGQYRLLDPQRGVRLMCPH